jgi:dynein regulatry complex protein 1
LERQKLIDETGDLHNQNEELKNLLNQYFQVRLVTLVNFLDQS